MRRASVKCVAAVSFDSDFADDRADALAFVGSPFQAQVVSGFGQLKMSRRQAGGGVGMDGLILRAVREIFPIAGSEDFHFTVHDFVGDAAEILNF